MTEFELDHDLPAAVEQLTRAGVPDAEAEARLLAEHVAADRATGGVGAHTLADLVAQRCAGVPLPRLLGRVHFRSVELLIGPDVFRPQPETAVVVQAAVDQLAWLVADGTTRPRCIDLCTGCGTVAVTVAAEAPDAEVHAVELDPAALAWAERNAEHNGVQVQLHLGDVAHVLPDEQGTFDLVLSNPPYVAVHELAGVAPEVRDHDPHISLEAGADGLDLIRAVERTAARLLRPGGMVIVEHSDRQGRSAPAVFRGSGDWEAVADHLDHDGLDRFLTATRI